MIQDYHYAILASRGIPAHCRRIFPCISRRFRQSRYVEKKRSIKQRLSPVVPRFDFFSQGPSATFNLGRKLGENLSAGNVIALTGELGCGKTLLTRGICDGLKVPLRQVNSPTYVLVNEYRGRLPVLHMDIYRLEGISDGFEIGLLDYLSRAEAGVLIVEWAEKILSILPTDHLRVEFAILAPKKRCLTFSSYGQKAGKLLSGIK